MWGSLRSNFRSVPVWVGLFLVALMLTLHAFSLSEDSPLGRSLSKPLTKLDTMIYDWRFQWLTPARPEGDTPIVIIDIDESTIKQEGWPWSRDKFARLIQGLETEGVQLVGFDIVFSEPGKNPVEEVLKSTDIEPAVKEALAQEQARFDTDAQLAAALPQSAVLGYFFHADGSRVGQLPEPLLDLGEADALGWRVLSLPDYTGNLPKLMEKARGAGFVTTRPDRDGVIRRSPFVIMHNNALYTSLSLEMARLYLNAPFVEAKTVSCRGRQTCVESLRLGDRVIPTDEHGAALVPYKGGRESFTYVSAGRVLRGDVPKGILQGAIAIVGTSALGLADLRTMPLQTQYPGVEVHANLLDAILQGDATHNYFVSRPDWAPGAVFVLLLISGLVFAIILPKLDPGYMLMVTLAWFFVLVLGDFAVWKSAGLDLPMAAILLTAFLIAAFNIVFGFLRANSQKREIKAMFGQYVPAAHVEQMLAHPESVNLEGDSREMTVLFSDIRSFTTISEGLSAPALKQMLNRFFTPITQVIFDNNGTIDKYVGDMVMAFWNAPLNDERHAHHAILAALAMQRATDQLKPTFVELGLPEVNIGIGINTGPMNVGDMGSEFRRAYTVLGDAVNLGSRLESITKFYGVKILVGETTHAQAPEFLYRLVDRIIVKGKTEPITVYEPVCLLADASDSRRERVERYNEAVGYYFARQWDAAEDILRQLAAQDTERKLYRVFLERVAELRQRPELTMSWSGVYEHKSK